ncbi:MAG TPA: hypothetical protein VGE40_09080 [Bacilli bacterium]
MHKIMDILRLSLETKRSNRAVARSLGLSHSTVKDIQSFELFDDIQICIERCGFFWRSDNSDITKRYFRESPGNRRTHIHVRREGSWFGNDRHGYVNAKQPFIWNIMQKADRWCQTIGWSPAERDM